MLADGIEEICHPLMAPALFVHKKSGDIQLCIDYRELNKRTVKIAYLLPCPDEVHDQIVGVLYFLHCTCRKAGYWQLPVIQHSRQRQHSHPFRPGNLPVSQHAFCLPVPYHWMNKVCHGYSLSLFTVMTSASILSDLCSKRWAHSRNVSDLCSFHTQALHCRRYILGFAEIAVLLHHLTGKGAATMN